VARIHAWIDGSLAGQPPEPWEVLLLDVHRWQACHDPGLAALAPMPPVSWRDVPAVPVDVYKRVRVGTVRDAAPPVLFRTSGTTGAGRGEHALRDTGLYDHAARAWAERCVPGRPGDVVALLDDPRRAPDSSLSHMVGSFAAGTTSWHVRDGTLDRAGLNAALAAAPGPVFLASTAFALAEWLTGPHVPSPAGSVLMVTGGFKGRVVSLDDDALYAAAARALPGARIVTEYGMTELSSQLWGWPGEAFRPPPWLRAVPVDPVTGDPLPPGAPGQLRFYDLANLDSSVGVETLDVGVVHGDGAVTLHGRVPSASARGCSLVVEEAWQARGDA
jgi:acyl-coenzyme A synthetase/AMP-(fatty) acid ligase